METRLSLIKDLGMMYATAKSKQMSRFGLYKCICGTTKKIRTISVSSGKTISCGCLASEVLKKRNFVHGFSRSKFYHTWTNMMSRCYNPKTKRYINYGKRGIEVCKEWHNLETFIEWATLTYIDNLTLDRIDVDGNYEPSNCRWTNIITQNQNSQKIRNNNKSGYRGVSLHKKARKWRVTININKKQIHLGFFDDAKSGAEAYDKYIMDNKLEHTTNF